MVIAVNTIPFLKKISDGEEEFFFETFSIISKQNPQHSFIFFLPESFDPSLKFPDNIKPVIVNAWAKSLLLWSLWYNYKIPLILKKNKADVFVSAGMCSLRTKVPQCLLISDLLYLEHPELVLKGRFNFYKKNTARSLVKAKRVVTLSEFSKKDILEKYKITENKIDVVYNGVNEIFTPLKSDEKVNLKEKYANGNEYFLFRGEIAPKNNLFNLLKAFSIFKKRLKSSMQLLICGPLGWKHEEFMESLRLFKFKNEVKLFSNLPKQTEAEITASAYAIIQTVYFQNFDTAIIAAMKCETPLIVNDINLMHEICDSAALYANCNHPKIIAEKMMEVYKNEELRKQLIKSGLEQGPKYSWNKTASLLWQSILKTSV